MQTYTKMNIYKYMYIFNELLSTNLFNEMLEYEDEQNAQPS